MEPPAARPPASPDWLDPSELRVGLGCMRLSTDADRDEQRAVETIAAAVDAGITVFDTARAYGRDETELGHNERLLARALGACNAPLARIVTKGGMTRPGGRWVPDGRARSLRADCEASLAALAGLPIDLYLLHAPDPRVPWRTSVRALARIHDDGLAARIGVANVNRAQLDEALELAPLAAVQVALSPFDDVALRGGVVERCLEAGLIVMAHSPLGGPRRAGRLAGKSPLGAIAAARGATPAEIALAWLLDLDASIVAIPGARRPETARSAAAAARLRLSDDDRAALATGLPRARGEDLRARRVAGDGEVVLIMGIPGAGKTETVADYVARGYRRLNRDEIGGSLRSVARALDEALASGERRVVLDNTYLTRASRSHVVDAAVRHALATRCVWLDTPLAQAQVNLVERLLDRHGALPGPDELRQLARREAGVMAPTSQMRALRELEPPAPDEGFDAVEVVPFARAPRAGRRRAGVFIAAAALRGAAWEHARAVGDLGDPRLVFDWSADGVARGLDDLVARLAAEVEGPVEGAFCPHGGGPPVCWCRPPLPGLPLAFARTHDVDPARSFVVGTGAAHRALAAALGASYVAIEPAESPPAGPSPSRSLEPGVVLAGFEVEELVGRGGMGVVYRARQRSLDRVVALKVLTPALAEDELYRARFLREARLAASIEHPNVLPVHEAGEAGGHLFLAVRFVEGEDLGFAARARGEARADPSRRRWSARSPRRSTPRMRRAWCTGTSSPRTCWSNVVGISSTRR